MTPIPLFVYGTLRDPDIVAAVLGRAISEVDCRAAQANGYRAIYYPGRVYPALIADQGADAEGLLLHGLSALDYATLDGFEGKEYRRAMIVVSAAGQLISAAAYLPTMNIPATGPDWTLKEWTTNHKPGAIAAEIASAGQIRARQIGAFAEPPERFGARPAPQQVLSAVGDPVPAWGDAQTAFGAGPVDCTLLQGDAIHTKDGDLVIHPIDHASLVLGWRDQIIYVDPVGGAGRYINLPKPTAILITHGHDDHYDPTTLIALADGDIPLIVNAETFERLPKPLKPNALILANGEQGTINQVPVAAIAAYNTTPERRRYHAEGVGNGYLVQFSDKRVYIAGDTEPTPAMLALQNIDVAFLPMNLPYTMTVDQAASAINTFEPRLIYPYHYRDTDLSTLEEKVGQASQVRLRNWYPEKN